MPQTVLVIGAQGVLGAAIARALADAGWDVVRSGRRPDGASDFQLLDLSDELALGRACEQVDLVINTVHHPTLAPERTVLRNGGTLIDLIELSRPERELLAATGTPAAAGTRAEGAPHPASARGERLPVSVAGQDVPATAGMEPEARGLVVTDTGLGGVAYLAIAELLDVHVEAGRAAYALMVSASGSTGRAGALFGHHLLTGSRHLPTVRLPLPRPWGARRCFEVDERHEVLRESVKGTPLAHHLCMQPGPLRGLLLVLNAGRLISLLPRATFTAGARKGSEELSHEPICEWVSVSGGDGCRLAIRTIEGRGYYRMTAAATLAFATALTQSSNGRRGVLSVDQLLMLDTVRPMLEQHEVFVREQPLVV